MENIDFLTLFQGFGTMMAGGWVLAVARISLVLLGMLLVYLGWKGVLEPMVMIPMGIGMVAINCGTLFMPGGGLSNLFLDPMLSDTDELMNMMQIDFLQPVYTLTFSNGLIACFVFMGIGTLLDVGFLLQKPYVSIFLALCAELGTFLVLPIAHAFGFSLGESASIAMVGGAVLTSITPVDKSPFPSGAAASLITHGVPGFTHGLGTVSVMTPILSFCVKSNPRYSKRDSPSPTAHSFARMPAV